MNTEQIIKKVANARLRGDSYLPYITCDELEALVQERDALKTDRDEWKDATLSANERFKKAEDALWKMGAELDALETQNTMLRVCLKNVIKVADRKTDEFDAARAALGETK